MNVVQPLGANVLGDFLDARSDQFARLHFVILNINHADSQPDFRIQLAERGQLLVASSRKLQDQVIRLQRIQKRNQTPPAADWSPPPPKARPAESRQCSLRPAAPYPPQSIPAAAAESPRCPSPARPYPGKSNSSAAAQACAAPYK